MNKIINRVIGITLMLGAVLGLMVSVAGLVFLWKYEMPVLTNIQGTLNLAYDTIQITQTNLDSLQASLRQTRTSLSTLQTGTQDMAQTLGDTSRATQSFGELVGVELVNVAKETHAGLASMQSSARLIDDTLGIISNIPFIGGVRYKPDVPLSASVQKVSTSLDTLPASLEKVQKDLKSTAQSLESIQKDMHQLSQDLGQIDTQLAATSENIQQYQSVLETFKHDLKNASDQLPGLLHAVVLAGSALCIWLVIAQIGLFTQGLERIK